MQSVIVTKHVAPRSRKRATNPGQYLIRQSGCLQPRTSTYPCPIDNCNHSFSRLSNLNRHYRETNEVQHKILAASCDRKQCKSCGKHFSTTTLRDRHEKSHSILVDITGLDVLPLPKTRLSSFNPEEDHLVSFCEDTRLPCVDNKLTEYEVDVYRLAPSRTLYERQNLYVELLDLSSSFEYLRDSIRSLTESYLKRDSSENAAIQWRVAALHSLQNRVEDIGCTALEDRREMKAILGCTALLLQYAVGRLSAHALLMLIYVGENSEPP
jgi:hypothetical protein